MKKKHLLLAISCVAMFVSCKEDKDIDKETPPVLAVYSERSISAPAEVSQHTVRFECNVAWEAKTDVSWCSIDNKQGEGKLGGQSLRIDVEENTMATVRTATIFIEAGSLKQEITLTQAGAVPVLYMTSTFIHVDGTEKTYSITVTGNMEWTAAVNDASSNNWLTITPESGFGDGTITVSVTGNQGYVRRYAFISVAGSEIQRRDTITIYQDGAETYSDPDIGITINGITWATRNVADFGRFTDFSTEQGKYYQFNRMVGYSYAGGYIERDFSHDVIVGGTVEPAFASEYAQENSEWNILNDPCPCGWRLPTAIELKNLLTSGYRWVDEPAGAWLGQDAATATFTSPGRAIFLPAGGLLVDDVIHYAGTGRYWTKNQDWIDNGKALTFWPLSSYPSQMNIERKLYALSVRCVKE